MSIISWIEKVSHCIPDRLYLYLKYFQRTHSWLHLKKPTTFNEKLQWLKLYNRNPLYITLVDKAEVKQYVADKIGSEYLIPTYGVWDSVEEINYEILPQQFVLKCTHDSGGVVICRDRSNFNQEDAAVKLTKHLSRSYFWHGREWPYKEVKHRVIAEKYMVDGIHKDLPDYKIHCFNGVPKMILVCSDRYQKTGMTEDFFTAEWEHMDIRRPGHPNASKEILRPKQLELMLELAEKLAEGLPFSRIDFYEVGDQIYFGEITLFPASGFTGFIPGEYDKELGRWIRLPETKE